MFIYDHRVREKKNVCVQINVMLDVEYLHTKKLKARGIGF